MPAGRKTLLTPKLKNQIGSNIKLGMPLKFAAEAAGIHEATFYRWMQEGEKATKGQYHEFCEYIKQCQSVAVKKHLNLITKAATEGSWQASAWILERRHPEEFGRNDKLNIDAKTKNENLNVNIETTEEIRAEILSKLSPRSKP